MSTTTLVFNAIETAARAHHGQYRKGTKIPYIVHPLAVGRHLIEIGCRDEVIAAGILHDTVEDSDLTLLEIEQKFGSEVSRFVAAVTEPVKAIAWEERKKHTLETLSDSPHEVLLIACADKLDNVRSLIREVREEGEIVWEKFGRPKPQQAWYYRSLADLFLSRKTEGEACGLFQDYFEAVVTLFSSHHHAE